jgi:hypothetical protein
MKLIIEKGQGWSEAVLDCNCGYDRFYKTASMMQSTFQITFTQKTDGPDSLHWDFTYLGSPLTLHYNIYLGVSLFPARLKDASVTDNNRAEELGQKVFASLLDDGWKEFDKGRTIGKPGHEGGTIVTDRENVHGARITIEEVRGNHEPFVITFGIYGLLFHTHAKPVLEKAREYTADLQYKMNKVFDLYELSEKHRSEEWYHEHDRLVHELTID